MREGYDRMLTRKGMEVSVSSGDQPAIFGVLLELKSFGAWLSGLAKPRVKEFSMRVKKRVKRGVKKGVKRAKSAPPEAYLAGSGVLVGSAAVLLLATTKSGRELLKRTTQLALHPQADEQESEEPQESDGQEDVENEPAKDADIEAEPEQDTNGDEESRVTDLKRRDQRPRSAAPGRRPRSPRKAATPRKTTNA
jgi:hypothetical protein